MGQFSATASYSRAQESGLRRGDLCMRARTGRLAAVLGVVGGSREFRWHPLLFCCSSVLLACFS